MTWADGHLVLDGLRKRFAGAARPALDRVDLDVEAGTILVLLGTSGAGKSTLLRIVAGLEEADAGRVLVGERVLSDPAICVPPEERGVGLVFQHLELWGHMTVAENIAFGLPGRPRGRSAAQNDRVRELADRVGVKELLTRSPATLSGGERQRVAIARTLAPAPSVVLYDEPLANLDPERRKDLRRLIRALCRGLSSTLVYVTHDPAEAMELGDEIAVLHEGRIADRGAPARLYRDPGSLVVARALGPVNALEGKADGEGVDTVLGRLPVETSAPSGRVLALVRPEQVEPGEGTLAEVVGVRPQRHEWVFEARVGDVPVEGTSEDRLEIGQQVALRVSGPVAVVDPDGGVS